MPRKIASLLIFFCLSICIPEYCKGFEQSEATTIENKAVLPLLDPAFAERKTQKIKLKNGLQALLVSDPLIDKSSAALVVMTGSWEDPEDAPGIAHFLEHMLFLGTQKYPGEMDYDRFISDHGGLFNAFTSNDFTGFVFTVDNNAFPEAIDRFSSFFKDPLFNPSGVDRELQAIDQEYAKNLENDDIRSYYVQKELGNPAHPNHSFGMGNRAALSGVSQTTLRQWYQDHYSANRMRLEVTSPLPLDQLKVLVTDAFKDIPDKNLPPIDIQTPLFTDSLKGKMIFTEPVKQVRQLLLIWELPEKFAAMRETKPELIVCHILGHEGKSSLIDELKNDKLAEGIQCGAQRIGGKSYELFIQIDLTDAGVKEINKVILRSFEAIANMRNKEFPHHLFDELKQMTTLDYQYQTKNDAFTSILYDVMLMANEDMDTFPEQSRTIKSYDPQAVRDLLSYLTPDNCLFMLTAPKNLANVSFDRTEKWLGTPYAVKPIPEKILALWNSAEPNPRIGLPAPNPYIPESTSLAHAIPAAQETDGNYIPKPKLLLDNGSGKIYFVQDAAYRVPTVNFTFNIKTPAINPAGTESNVLGDLFAKHAQEALSYYTYPAAEAGLNFSIERSDYGFMVTIGGYSDRAKALFLDLINALKDAKPREQKYRAYKETLQRQYQNMSLETPLVQTDELLKNILYKDYALSKAKAAALKKITYDDFSDFFNTVFSNTYIEGLIYGNIVESDAQTLVDSFQESLGSSPYPEGKHMQAEVIELPAEKGPFLLEHKSKVQGNAAVLVVAMDPFTFQRRAAQQLLMQAIKEPFFTTLRTQQQTGYIVLSQADELEQHMFNTFAVQSNTHDGRDLLARFELFLESFIQEIDKGEVPVERFANIKNAQLSILKQPPKNLSDMGTLLYKLAFSYNGDFDRIVKRIDSLEKLTYDEFVEIAKETFGKGNRRRLALLFSGSIPGEGGLKYHRLCNASQLKDEATYSPAETPGKHE